MQLYLLVEVSACPCRDLGLCQDGDWSSQEESQEEAARKHAGLGEEERKTREGLAGERPGWLLLQCGLSCGIATGWSVEVTTQK